MSNLQPDLSECAFELAAVRTSLGNVERVLEILLTNGMIGPAGMPPLLATKTEVGALQRRVGVVTSRIELADLRIRFIGKMFRGVRAPGRDLARQILQWEADAPEEAKAA